MRNKIAEALDLLPWGAGLVAAAGWIYVMWGVSFGHQFRDIGLWILAVGCSAPLLFLVVVAVTAAALERLSGDKGK